MTALIIGCGFLGTRIAQQLLSRGDVVYGTTTDPRGAKALSSLGVRPLILDVTQPLTLAALTPVTQIESLNVFYLVPRQNGEAGPDHVIKALKPAHIRRAVLASSTVVYGQSDETFTADSPTCPADERGRMQLEAEQQWLGAGERFCVVRLAGLYGDHRIIGKRALLDGAPVVGDAHAVLNLIHVEDAASLMIAVTEQPRAARIELGVDNCPVPRLDYYRYLAGQIGAGDPIALDPTQSQEILGIDPNKLRRASFKRCDNTPTRRRTGWSPKYSDYRAGIDAALAQGTGGMIS